MLNQHMRYFVPLRDHQQRACFVIEIKSGETSAENELELEQIESVFYVLEKCGDELLAEHYASSTSARTALMSPLSAFAFENEFDNDKFTILFEKAYVAFVMRRLMSSVQSGAIDELPASADYVDLIKLVGELIDYPQFVETRTINEPMLALMAGYDPTTTNFQFAATPGTTKFNINTETYTNGE